MLGSIIVDDESGALRELARRLTSELEASVEARRADLEKIRSWAEQSKTDVGGAAVVPLAELLALLESLTPPAPKPKDATPAPTSGSA